MIESAEGPAPKGRSISTTRTILLLAIASWAGFLLVRATGPADLLGRDQVKLASYQLDIIENDSWLWQQDQDGHFASKPPLTQWLGAVASEALGTFHRLTYAFPSWWATLITILILVGWVGREFGAAAAIWAPLLLLCHQLGLREILLARSDPLFQCTTLLLALGIWRCWVDGAGPWPLVLAGTAALMTKGPLGWAMALLGLLAYRFDPPTERLRLPRRSIVVGLIGSLVIPVIWLAAAQYDSGGLAIDKLIHDELIDHSIGSRVAPNQQSVTHHLLPLAWFLTRLAPTGLIAVIAAVRLIRRPSPRPRERRAERFLLCWMIAGLLLLCISTHHRFIHLLVILPPTAMLAAREVSRWFSPQRNTVYAILALSSVLPIAAAYLDVLDIHSPHIVETKQLEGFCREVESHVRPDTQLEFFHADPATQVLLKRHRAPLADSRVGELLSSETHSLVVVGDENLFRKHASEQGIEQFEVLVRESFGEDKLTLYSGQGRQPSESPRRPVTRNYFILTLLSILTAIGFYWALRFAAAGVAGSPSSPERL
ncbi:MAG TPA: hypothetical protein EYQ08_01685 [Planctomycetes bacterium]|nr:hypothetical protein [Planctomycetota bacterium]HIK82349.1 hypothetical protein [Planctomycetota bacterium]